jgi:translation elongation factor EF-G
VRRRLAFDSSRRELIAKNRPTPRSARPKEGGRHRADIGDIVGDLSSRRGRITDTQPVASGPTKVVAQVPMAELSDYGARLTSITAGEGSYTIEFNHYEPAPHHVQQKLSQQFRPKEEA